MYIKNFGEFYLNQIEYASTIVLSRTQNLSQEKLDAALALIREHNSKARVVTTPWSEISGKNILTAIEGDNSFTEDLLKEAEVCPTCGHHHHDGEHCHHDHDEHDHEHCHHDHDEHDHEHCHHDHDEHDHEHCCHDHNGHHHHHADEVFTSWGKETAKHFTKEEIEKILSALNDTEKYGSKLNEAALAELFDC